MTDHDQQLPHVGQVSYGEAVGSWHQMATAVRPRLCSFAGSQFCLSGQYFSITAADFSLPDRSSERLLRPLKLTGQADSRFGEAWLAGPCGWFFSN
ncbi:MAG TPA: hypothetical protein VF881_17795, partial [Polyangiaceae bacterium]